ncbi:uncharacterized protein isoform X2 [Danio rerio]|uniref:Uncharacterized protein isoform X2 n=1 Tax=Danio rerio TaxID=7955 RepID=A0AC58HI27_DANRE|nr:uncharacterized protein LOC101885445 isoform X2 [Danio rerio]|eukprot:XP_021322584.1 uncharacterized protein LOC101885445 isoform X2 [Danio rerio]
MMGSVQLSYFRLLNLFIAALLECGAQRPCEQPHQLNISRVQRDSMSISCLTTTHLLETLTVKLRKNNPVKDILISPASEHQKWSVSKHAGNIRLNLKDIQQTDEGLYDCEVYKDQDCLNATRFTLTVKDCTKMKSVTAVSGSAVLLPCSEHPQRNTTDKVTWKVIEGHRSTDITQYRSSSTTSNSTEKLSNPLFERAKQLENGSLVIRDSVKADDLWYRCRVNDTTCYEVKLVIKVPGLVTAKSTTLFTTVTPKIPAGHSRGNTDTTANNLTAVVMSTVVSLLTIISLIICVIVYFKKRKHINNSHKLNRPLSVYYSYVAEGYDVPLYSLVEQTSASMSTFDTRPSEALAYEPYAKCEDYQFRNE